MSRATTGTAYGQVIEYIQGQSSPPEDPLFPGGQNLICGPFIDRLYLASFTNPPTADTPFHYLRPAQSPSKRSSKAPSGPTIAPAKVNPPVYFSIDKTLLYNAFHADFGPLHIGHLYRFAVQLHEVLGAPANEDRPVVFWSSADSRSTYRMPLQISSMY